MNIIEKYKIHITYNENLSLSCMNKILDSISKGYNDVNRELGVKDPNKISDLNPVINNIEHGSLILDLIVNFVGNVASEIVVNMILKRLIKSKDKNTDFELHYKENNDGSKEIDIHIHN